MNIPYYQQMGIKNINSVSAFENAIPFIDKDIVRKSWESFLLPRMDKNKVVEGTTGGTWGRPLKLIIPKNKACCCVKHNIFTVGKSRLER